MIDQQCSIDEFVANTAKYIPSLKDRQGFGLQLIAGNQCFCKVTRFGQVEIVRVSSLLLT
ncbi:MAG: hypothetical protein ACLTEE_02520 [Anaerobutyricum hallii]